jgi:hypothetical protein
MEQILLLVSVVVALLVIFTNSGQKVVKDVSKSVSSLTKNSKSGFPVVLVIVIVLVALICLSRKQLMEGLSDTFDLKISSDMTIKNFCENMLIPDYKKCTGTGGHPLPLSLENCKLVKEQAKTNITDGKWDALVQMYGNIWPIGCPKESPNSEQASLIPCETSVNTDNTTNDNTPTNEKTSTNKNTPTNEEKK